MISEVITTTDIEHNKIYLMIQKFTLNQYKNNAKKYFNYLQEWGLPSESQQSKFIPIDLRNTEEINNYFLRVAGHLTVNVETLNYYNKYSEADIWEAFHKIKNHAIGIDNII